MEVKAEIKLAKEPWGSEEESALFSQKAEHKKDGALFFRSHISAPGVRNTAAARTLGRSDFSPHICFISHIDHYCVLVLQSNGLRIGH